MEGSPHILMFGGTGRIGPAVLDELKQTNLITLFSRTVRNDLVAPHRVIQCDIRDTEATTRAVQIALSTHSCSPTRPLAILYMATEGILEKTSRPIDDEFAVAVGGLNTVVNAVADHTPLPDDIAVLFVSSLAVETFPRAGLEYVVGKAAGEQYCRHMARNPPKGNWRFNVPENWTGFSGFRAHNGLSAPSGFLARQRVTRDLRPSLFSLFPHVGVMT